VRPYKGRSCGSKPSYSAKTLIWLVVRIFRIAPLGSGPPTHWFGWFKQSASANQIEQPPSNCRTISYGIDDTLDGHEALAIGKPKQREQLGLVLVSAFNKLDIGRDTFALSGWHNGGAA
jgi:hypothetical protein